MSKTKKKKEVKQQYTVKNAVVNYYLLLMLTVFPLFYTNAHINIRHDKLYMFYALSGALIACMLLILLVYFTERKNRPDDGTGKWYLQLSVTDYAFGAFALCCVFSTVLSEYPWYAFRGIWYASTGRNNGLLLILCYFLVYIIVSRLYQFRDYVFPAAAACSVIVSVLAVLHYFYIDPLGMYNGYNSYSIENFMSTIGNKNIVSCYCCLMIPLFAVLYINCEKLWLRVLYACSCAAVFAALMCSDSDSGLLGLVPVMAVLLLFYSRKPAALRSLFALTAYMLAGSKAVWLISFAAQKRKGLGALQSSVVYGSTGWILLAVFAAAAVALALVIGRNPDLTFPRFVPAALVGVYAAALLTLVGLFINYTFIDTTSQLNGTMKLFRFDDRWGTHRGFMWIRSWDIFKGFGLKDKLFGCGPDTFYSVFAPYFGELEARFGDETTNCAHNEFLNYLITTGVFGLTAYLVTFISAVAAAFKAARRNFLALAFCAPVLCYLIQSTVNIATPIVTPLLFIFLALTVNITRVVNKEKQGE